MKENTLEIKVQDVQSQRETTLSSHLVLDGNGDLSKLRHSTRVNNELKYHHRRRDHHTVREKLFSKRSLFVQNALEFDGRANNGIGPETLSANESDYGFCPLSPEYSELPPKVMLNSQEPYQSPPLAHLEESRISERFRAEREISELFGEPLQIDGETYFIHGELKNQVRGKGNVLDAIEILRDVGQQHITYTRTPAGIFVYPANTYEEQYGHLDSGNRRIASAQLEKTTLLASNLFESAPVHQRNGNVDSIITGRTGYLEGNTPIRQRLAEIEGAERRFTKLLEARTD